MISSNSEKNFLNGKNILVTGASKGIGKYVAKELALLELILFYSHKTKKDLMKYMMILKKIHNRNH